MKIVLQAFCFVWGPQFQPGLQDGSPVQRRRAHINHSIPGYGSWRGVVYVVGLKYNFAVGRHRYTVTICKGESLVVV